MDTSKPGRGGWWSLLLLTPALEILLVPELFPRALARILFPGEQLWGLTAGLWNLVTGFPLLCFGVALWWEWPKHETASARVYHSLALSLGLAVVNLGIAFAGCSLIVGIMKNR